MAGKLKIIVKQQKSNLSFSRVTESAAMGGDLYVFNIKLQYYDGFGETANVGDVLYTEGSQVNYDYLLIKSLDNIVLNGDGFLNVEVYVHCIIPINQHKTFWVSILGSPQFSFDLVSV